MKPNANGLRSGDGRLENLPFSSRWGAFGLICLEWVLLKKNTIWRIKLVTLDSSFSTVVLIPSCSGLSFLATLFVAASIKLNYWNIDFHLISQNHHGGFLVDNLGCYIGLVTRIPCLYYYYSKYSVYNHYKTPFDHHHHHHYHWTRRSRRRRRARVGRSTRFDARRIHGVRYQSTGSFRYVGMSLDSMG